MRTAVVLVALVSGLVSSEPAAAPCIDLEGDSHGGGCPLGLLRDPSGNLSFQGEVFGRTEVFNFDKPGLANAVGRRLPGRPFDVRFIGSRQVRFPR